MTRIIQTRPIQFAVLVPLAALAEFLSHEQQFLARMAEHEGVGRLEVGELHLVRTRHLFDHRTLEVDNLIVGDDKNVVLAVCIGHGEGHLIVVVFAEVRIALLILQKVVHPAHVPLEVEAETAVDRRAGDHRPCRGLLSDHDRTGAALMDNRVEMAEEFNCLEVLVLTVLVGNPLTVLSAVIQIEHGGDRIDAQTVDVILAQPVEGVGNQEVLDLVASEVKHLGSPVRMLALARVGVLIQRTAVEVCQTVGIAREVRRHPVQNDADAVTVHVIDKVHEVLRQTVARGRRIVAGDLITPGGIQRMLRNADQLDMGVIHLFEVFGQNRSEFAEIIESRIVLVLRCVLAPGARMHLVDRHRGLLEIEALARLHPAGVSPLEAVNRGDAGGGARTQLGAGAERIALERCLSVLSGDGILVQLALLELGDKQFVDAERLQTVHRM